ncbi:HNH endonuclease [Chryseobacterium caseinilyticum]|uniref:HNH endonuclease n=1 Tax=Chryseobacterium caseinilyticum TaxID=2771428 RepID=A0ABR8ZAU0_9FLAO|nr:hypothetical protein [Chryseobacterium caseinilyticum]MBD8082351.1 hypothetical protein [Chryseobacterium caseinilyticum]
MMKCVYIGENEYDTFATIVTEKYNPSKAVLTTIKTRVESCYNQYLFRFDELEAKQFSEFSAAEVEEKKHLQGCYSSLTKTGIPIKSSILSSQPDVLKTLCPYCLLEAPKTLDHYIGKDEFPEYSFLVKNLIPCCYSCNNIKDIKWRDSYRRRFIHFYNDNFFEEQFLFASLRIIESTPIINLSLVKPQNLDDDSFQIVSWHFEDLKLLDQYEQKCNTLLSTEIKIMKDGNFNDGLTLQQIEVQLQRREKNFADDYGINYWKSIMFQCMSQNVKDLLTC